MTELEAREILNEARAVCPSFVRPKLGGGFWLYKVARDGRTIDVYTMPRSKCRATWRRVTTVEDITVPVDIRARLS
jgi:hypothetical protein